MSKNGRRRLGERFAAIPLEVLEHEACTTLNPTAFKVLVVIAAGYSGRNNGTMACTQVWGEKFGIRGTDTARLALRELVQRGLLEVTRPGIKMRSTPTLYALTWQPINSRDGRLLDRAELPPRGFRNWKPKTEFHPDPKGEVTPTAGVQHRRLTPICPGMNGSLTPMVGDTLRILGGVPPFATSSPAHPASAGATRPKTRRAAATSRSRQ